MNGAGATQHCTQPDTHTTTGWLGRKGKRKDQFLKWTKSLADYNPADAEAACQQQQQQSNVYHTTTVSSKR